MSNHSLFGHERPATTGSLFGHSPILGPGEYPEPPIHGWSLSRLQDFERCAWRTELGVNRKIRPPKHESALRGIETHKGSEAYFKLETESLDWAAGCLERLRSYRALVESGEYEVTVEEPWAVDRDYNRLDWFDKTVWHRSALDLFLVHRETHHAKIMDAKTGKHENKALPHREQGQLYAAIAAKLYPSIPAFDVEFLYLDHDKSRAWRYTRDQALALLPQFEKRGNTLTGCVRFEPRPSRWNCQYCPFNNTELGDQRCEFAWEG